MAIVGCLECHKEMSGYTESCPFCGELNTCRQFRKKSVSLLLGVGIFFLPLLFSWVTLSEGYSVTSRVISFAWLLFPVFVVALVG